MTKPSIHLVILSAFFAALLMAMPLSSEAADTPKPQPTSQGDELGEGGITFNSKLHLQVGVCGKNRYRMFDSLGITPATKPLAIPKCRWWAVKPLGGVSLADLVAEAKAQGIKGVCLGNASDTDIAGLSGWPNLQILDLSLTKVTDAGMGYVGEFRGLQTLSLYGTKITDAGLTHIRGLTGLRTLDLGNTGITDAGLANIRDLAGVRWLRLGGTQISDAGLANIKNMGELQTLDLGGSNISGTGLGNIKDLKGLRELYLGGTQINDAGLARIKGLTGLRTLDLASTRVTEAGLADLRKALPNTTITYSPAAWPPFR